MADEIDDIVSLIGRQGFQDFDAVHNWLGVEQSRSLDDNWILRFDDVGMGWVVLNSRDKLKPAYFVCPIKGCFKYTYGGLVCDDHPPWIQLVTIDSNSSDYSTGSLSVDEVGADEDDAAVRSSTSISVSDMVEVQLTRIGLEEGIMTSKLIGDVLDELYQTRKGYFGSQTSDEFMHHYMLHQVWRWNFWSKRYNVIVRKSYQYSRSFKIDSIDGRFTFYSCGHFVSCQNVAVFYNPLKPVHRYCYAHRDECDLENKRINAATARSLKQSMFRDLGKSISGNNGTLTSQWDALYTFLYERGDSGYLVRREQVEVVLQLSQDGQLRIEDLISNAYKYICIGGRYSCLLVMSKVDEDGNNNLFCKKCKPKKGRFDPRQIIASTTYGSRAGDFFCYW